MVDVAGATRRKLPVVIVTSFEPRVLREEDVEEDGLDGEADGQHGENEAALSPAVPRRVGQVGQIFFLKRKSR